MKDKAWIQAAIDVEDIDVAKRIAFMALDNGAEWLEVGTPLLYQYGHAAIGMIRKAVGNNAVLVADYKTSIAALCARQAKHEGADYILLSAGYSDWALTHSVSYSKEIGITPIFYPNVRPEDLYSCAKQLRDLGAPHIFTHHYSEITAEDGSKTRFDNIASLKELPGIQLGVTSDDFDEAGHAVVSGADWITFGWVLRNPDPVTCRRWIDMIHNAR